eukprot:scaffold78463_cov28-Tisochrysis_lutea.AAC.2
MAISSASSALPSSNGVTLESVCGDGSSCGSPTVICGDRAVGVEPATNGDARVQAGEGDCTKALRVDMGERCNRESIDGDRICVAVDPVRSAVDEGVCRWRDAGGA